MKHYLSLSVRYGDGTPVEVRSMADGVVTTWDVEKLLRNRPVKTGQAVLNVADGSGEWEVELKMSEDRMGYMAKALKGVPEEPLVVPEGVVAARVNPDTGLRDPDGKLVEYFYHEAVPPENEGGGSESATPAGSKPADEVKNQLF